MSWWGSARCGTLDLPIKEDPPYCREIKRLLSEITQKRAAGVCGIPAVQLKVGGCSLAMWLCAKIVQVWSTNVDPLKEKEA